MAEKFSNFHTLCAKKLSLNSRNFFVVGFYKTVAAECAKQRRQKEMELEIMTGTIRGWEGEDLHSLGDIIHIGSVTVGPTDQKDRYFVLFASNLLILSVSSRMSGFIYEVTFHSSVEIS